MTFPGGTLRARGIMGRLLNMAVLEKMASERSGDGGTFNVGFGPYAAFRDNGVWFIVNNEGVGAAVSENDPYMVPLYRKLEGAIQLFPELQGSLRPADVEELLGEPIDLADLIRVFGGRLEDNFWIWHRVLSPQEGVDVSRRTASPDSGQ